MPNIQLKGKYGEGLSVQVSEQDFDFASKLRLRVSDTGYVKTWHKGKHRPLHCLLVQPPKGKQIDHINGDKLDNRRENLRLATIRQNNANVPARSDTGAKCVYRDKTTKASYRVSVTVKGKSSHIGNFKNFHHAQLVADLWLVDLYGAFARTNLPIVAYG